MKTANKVFVPALIKVFKCYDWDMIPECVLRPYATFLSEFVVDKTHTTNDLQYIFRLTLRIKASTEWIKYVQNPCSIMMNPSKATEYGNAIVSVPHFAAYRQFFSHEYFELMFKVL